MSNEQTVKEFYVLALLAENKGDTLFLKEKYDSSSGLYFWSLSKWSEKNSVKEFTTKSEVNDMKRQMKKNFTLFGECEQSEEEKLKQIRSLKIKTVTISVS